MSLDCAIQKNHGHTWWANKLGLPTKNYRRKWNEEDCKIQLEEVVRFYSQTQNYFPTLRQIQDYFGDTRLLNYINRNYDGLYKLAESYNLTIKEGAYSTGLYGENELQKKLESLGFKVDKEPTNCIYDFTVNNIVRIDCKYSNIYHGKTGDFYSFNLEDSHPDCDIFICLFKDKNEELQFLVIPHVFVFNYKQISVGIEKSKWLKFKNRFDYLIKYEEFFKGLKDNG